MSRKNSKNPYWEEQTEEIKETEHTTNDANIIIVNDANIIMVETNMKTTIDPNFTKQKKERDEEQQLINDIQNLNWRMRCKRCVDLKVDSIKILYERVLCLWLTYNDEEYIKHCVDHGLEREDDIRSYIVDYTHCDLFVLFAVYDEYPHRDQWVKNLNHMIARTKEKQESRRIKESRNRPSYKDECKEKEKEIEKKDKQLQDKTEEAFTLSLKIVEIEEEKRKIEETDKEKITRLEAEVKGLKEIIAQRDRELAEARSEIERLKSQKAM